MTIKKCQFTKNYASALSKNIFIGFSRLSIDSTTFQDSLALTPDSSVKGSFIHMIMSVNLNITNSVFVNGYAAMGGALYL